MKKTLSIIICMFIGLYVHAENDYETLAQAIRKEVWSWDLPAFNRRDIPDEYREESSVIVAAHSHLSIYTRSKLNAALRMDKKQYCLNVYRALIKINDKAARDEYSQFDYYAESKLKVWRTVLAEKQQFMGIRIIKPDNSIKDIETEVHKITDDQDKVHRIAIPNLEVGDMIEYYHAENTELKNRELNPFLFPFATNKPMLSYTIHCELDKDMVSEYRSINGAPALTLTSSEGENFLLDAASTGIADKEPELWYESMRQTPMIYLRIRNERGKTIPAPKYLRPKGLHKDIPLHTLEQEGLEHFLQRYAYEDYFTFTNSIRIDANKLWKNYSKKYPTLNDREKADYLYRALFYEWRHGEKHYTPAKFMYMLYYLFEKAGVECEIGMTTAKEMEELDQLADAEHLTYALRLADGTCYFYPTLYPVPGMIPASYRGEPVDWVDGKNLKESIKGSFRREHFPANEASEAVTEYKIEARLSDKYSDALEIKRQCTIPEGYTKAVLQDLLVCSQDYHNAMRALLEIPKTLLEEAGNKEKESLRTFFKQERKEEIYRYQYETELYNEIPPKEVYEYGIDHIGLTESFPDLKYHLRYAIPEAVKKSGNDILISIEKLIGTFPNILQSQRTPQHETLHYQARTTVWEISLQIPENFLVDTENIKRLNKNITNAFGSFQASAEYYDGILKMSVKRIQNKDKLPPEEFPQYLEIMDAAHEFVSQQVLISKEE